MRVVGPILVLAVLASGCGRGAEPVGVVAPAQQATTIAPAADSSTSDLASTSTSTTTTIPEQLDAELGLNPEDVIPLTLDGWTEVQRFPLRISDDSSSSGSDCAEWNQLTKLDAEWEGPYARARWEKSGSSLDQDVLDRGEASSRRFVELVALIPDACPGLAIDDGPKLTVERIDTDDSNAAVMVLRWVDEDHVWWIGAASRMNVVSLVSLEGSEAEASRLEAEFTQAFSHLNSALEEAKPVPLDSIVVTDEPDSSTATTTKVVPVDDPETVDSYLFRDSSALLLETTGPLEGWGGQYSLVELPDVDISACPKGPSTADIASETFDGWLEVEAELSSPNGSESIIHAVGETTPGIDADAIVMHLIEFDDCAEPFAHQGLHMFDSGSLVDLPEGVTAGIYWTFAHPGRTERNVIIADISLDGRVVSTIGYSNEERAVTIDDIQPLVEEVATRYRRTADLFE